MPSWVVFRCDDESDEFEPVGRITAAAELDARLGAHARWMDHAGVRLRLVSAEDAHPVLARFEHIDLMEQSRRLDEIFDDRITP